LKNVAGSMPAAGPKASQTTAVGHCPICKQAAMARFRPFCSQRCADLDLGRWLTGGYAIPSEGPGKVDENDP
jgi:uncharacterized protein